MHLHIAACLWDANDKSLPASRCFDESWVDKLYRNFRRHLSMPFRFVLFTDREREFKEPIEQERLTTTPAHYGCLIEPFKLNEPTMVVGLDTIAVANIDHFARYCLNGDLAGDLPALPRNPYAPYQIINPIALVPRGFRLIFDEWRGENDMDWLRKQDTAFIDDRWPGQVLSLKQHQVRTKGLQGAKVIYMHGEPKADALGHLDWVQTHWQ